MCVRARVRVRVRERQKQRQRQRKRKRKRKRKSKFSADRASAQICARSLGIDQSLRAYAQLNP